MTTSIDAPHQQLHSPFHEFERTVYGEARGWFGETACLVSGVKDALERDIPLDELFATLEREQPLQDLLASNENPVLEAMYRGTVRGLRAAFEQDIKLLSTAVTQFQRCFPVEPGLRPHHGQWQMLAPDHDLAKFRELCGTEAQTPAFWYAWDLWQSIRPCSVPNGPVLTASTPVLLVAEGGFRRAGQNGEIALLTVELLRDGGAEFTPDPRALGLTCLTQNSRTSSDGFHTAMQRAWYLSGVWSLGWRGRWRITQFVANDRVRGQPIETESFHGRSAEAATCAALWTAAGGIPGVSESNGQLGQAVKSPRQCQLSPWCAVTAKLGDLPECGRRSKLPLLPIEGLSDKLHSAFEADLATVLISDSQPPESLGKSPDGRVRRERTMGGAWTEMEYGIRRVRQFQHRFAAEWHAHWRNDVDDPNFYAARLGHPLPIGVDPRQPGKTSPVDATTLFFASQAFRWLNEPHDKKEFLQPAAFRAERPGAAPRRSKADNANWEPIDSDPVVARSVLVQRILRPLDDPESWSRLTVTTDAGIGKTTNLKWLAGAINELQGPSLAFFLTMTELGGKAADDVLSTLLRDKFRQMAGQSPLDPVTTADLKQDPDVTLLKERRQRGELVLIIDELDQSLQSSIDILRELLTSELWRKCRFVLGGRPYALKMHWKTLFQSSAPPFEFIRAEEFEPWQQKLFLGRQVTDASQWRIDLIRSQARPMLAVPRVLEYLSTLGDRELTKMKNPSHVYFQAIRHMVIEALNGSASSRAKLTATGQVVGKVGQAQIELAEQLLSAMAFVMTSMSEVDLEPTSETYGREQPNFDSIKPEAPYREFKRQLCKVFFGTDDNQNYTRLGTWLDGLGAMDVVLKSASFFDAPVNVEGLNGVLWRNKSLQEFLTARWLASFARPEHSQVMSKWMYLAGDVATEAYHDINQYLAEMPYDDDLQVLDGEVWVNSMEPIYRPSDGTLLGTKRSTEMLFRSWRTMHALAGEPVIDWWDCSYQDVVALEAKLKSGQRIPAGRATVPRAAEVLRAFRGEFQAILDGTGGSRLPPAVRVERQKIARELIERFIKVDGGCFRMGAPEDQQGMGRKLRHWWSRILASPDDVERIVRQHVVKRDDWEAGRRGTCRYENAVKNWVKLIAPRDVQQIEAQQYPKDETPEAGEQNQRVAEFIMSEFPVLSAWYRLFDVAHGLEDAWFRDDFAKHSPSPRHPAIYLSWWDCWAFCQWLNWRDNDHTIHCRLPHEPEFEFVAKHAEHWDWSYWWGEEFEVSDVSMCNANRRLQMTRPPEEAAASLRGPLMAGQRGFCDLLGNVWEWMANKYRARYSRTDSTNNCPDRVLRGGSWVDGDRGNRASNRVRTTPQFHGAYVGCRLCAYRERDQ